MEGHRWLLILMPFLKPTASRFPSAAVYTKLKKDIHITRTNVFRAAFSIAMSETRHTGTVLSAWQKNGGFCNINPNDSMEALLASFADIEQGGLTELKAGQKVSYVVVNTPGDNRPNPEARVGIIEACPEQKDIAKTRLNGH
ncbi:MAG: hypothetical protein Q9184_005326 [Pyrenodesmia sp. 2 TL-2023]